MCKFQGSVLFLSDISSRGAFVCLYICKFEKKILPDGKYFFCEYHLLQYYDRQVKVKFQGRGIFFMRDIQPRGISAKVPNKLSLDFFYNPGTEHIFFT